MPSATNLIKRAYRKIGADSRLKAASPEAIEDGRVELIAMVAEWTDDDINFGFTPPKQASDETSVPASVENAVTSNLAIRCAPFFDNAEAVVSQALIISARISLDNLKNYKSKSAPNKIVSGTMPLGAGNEEWVNPPAFAGPDFELSDTEGREGTTGTDFKRNC